MENPFQLKTSFHWIRSKQTKTLFEMLIERLKKQLLKQLKRKEQNSFVQD
jgi:hypothetical protein